MSTTSHRGAVIPTAWRIWRTTYLDSGPQRHASWRIWWRSTPGAHPISRRADRQKRRKRPIGSSAGGSWLLHDCNGCVLRQLESTMVQLARAACCRIAFWVSWDFDTLETLRCAFLHQARHAWRRWMDFASLGYPLPPVHPQYIPVFPPSSDFLWSFNRSRSIYNYLFASHISMQFKRHSFTQ